MRTSPRSEVLAVPADQVTAAPRAETDDRNVTRWLVATLLAVLAALVVGGITRLTESGLSITEWQPLAGVLPPLNDAAWQRAFDSYLRIPESQTVHAGLTLGQFKNLFWWEWLHRILARLVGLVIAVPYFVLLARGKFRPEHRFTLISLPLLTALQGALGWYMVRSGLTERTDVSQYRLVAHLSLALVIYIIALWTLLGLRTRRREASPAPATSHLQPHRGGASARWSLGLCGLVGLTIVSGAFVAGLDAGHIFNTFPLMGGTVVPPGYGALTGWRNAFENPIAAQFHHRVLALLTLAAVFVGWLRIRQQYPAGSATDWMRGANTAGPRRAANLALAAAMAQVALGVATLVMRVPIPLAALHQLCAVALLSALMVAARETMAAPRPTAAPVRRPPYDESASFTTRATSAAE